jgi:[ribosomal protein S5]-alanine N-acetyltransferase
MDDFKAWVALRKGSRNFLEQWEPEWNDDEFARSSFRYRLYIYNKLATEERSQSLFAFTSDGINLMGAINVSNIRRGVSQSATLGYWIGEPYARKGYMSNALELVSQYSFNDLALHRLEAACLPHNQASISLLKKSKFEQEGIAKSYLKIAGNWEDHLLFARLKT